MKLDSKYFDSIRIQPKRGRSRSAPEMDSGVTCEWRGCERRGTYRAPKGRDREGEYYHFCREHVAAYNKTYNYFAGMNDREIADFQRAAMFGHRPTWTMGVRREELSENWGFASGATVDDPFGLLRGARGYKESPRRPKRVIHQAARKHLAALNLDEHATPDEIRSQFKLLVKMHHPDHNGGDRSSEDRFREVVTAYNYLKQTGLC